MVSLDRPVVIKKVQGKDHIPRALVERDVLKQCESPFIVKLQTSSLKDGAVYMVLEYLPHDLRYIQHNSKTLTKK